MNEVYFNIKLTITFILITSFVAFRNLKFEQYANFHGIDFEWLSINYTITWAIDQSQNNIIYLKDTVCASWIPSICQWKYKEKSIKCLSAIKESYNWYYNWWYFTASNPNCKTNL